MNNKLIEISKETMNIIKNGCYSCPMEIPLPSDNYDDVKVYSPELLKPTRQSAEKMIKIAQKKNDTHTIVFAKQDSFSAAMELDNALVINFASAINPGGGFLAGASAQEESLCRASTLYASISSEVAKEMYEYNRRNYNPLYSDYMLLSPNVYVFRNCTGDFLINPVKVAVLSAAAVNKRGPAMNVPQKHIDKAMIQRIQYMLSVAATENYKNIVLGAWGCGAFGNDARAVASYFKKVIFEDNFLDVFDEIVFSIPEGKNEHKMDIFCEVFDED